MLTTAPVAARQHYAPILIAMGLVAIACLAVVFHNGVAPMVDSWGADEYSYAYLIPPITAWLLWQRRAELSAANPGPSWWGVLVLAAGLTLALFGELSTIYTVIQYGLIVCIYGIALTLTGWRGMRIMWAPLLYLVFMVPLPNFLYQGLSGHLQLISSQLGTSVIRFFGLPVFLEGNVIDLGVYKLQVVEACNGLRYLFPLLSFGYLCSLLYKGPWWHKVILMLSTLPITVAVNSFRIGMTGILVNYWGIEQAEGFLHLFEGWIIFLAAVAILFAEMWLLARVTGRGGSLADLLNVDALWPQRRPQPASGQRPPVPARRWLSGSVLTAAALLVFAALAGVAAPARTEFIPDRPRDFATFPMGLGDWQGHEQQMEQIYVDALKFDDYLLADYWRKGTPGGVNLYVAYYNSQRKGASVHSPRSCIPGGGWEISRLETVTLPGAAPSGADLHVNKVIISRGSERQLVYYWFDQRGRQMTNEYYVKLMLFWDALTRHRTDGALVRLVTPLRTEESVADAEKRLQDFVQAAYPQVSSRIPGAMTIAPSGRPQSTPVTQQ